MKSVKKIKQVQSVDLCVIKPGWTAEILIHVGLEQPAGFTVPGILVWRNRDDLSPRRICSL